MIALLIALIICEDKCSMGSSMCSNNMLSMCDENGHWVTTDCSDDTECSTKNNSMACVPITKEKGKGSKMDDSKIMEQLLKLTKDKEFVKRLKDELQKDKEESTDTDNEDDAEDTNSDEEEDEPISDHDEEDESEREKKQKKTSKYKDKSSGSKKPPKKEKSGDKTSVKKNPPKKDKLNKSKNAVKVVKGDHPKKLNTKDHNEDVKHERQNIKTVTYYKMDQKEKESVTITVFKTIVQKEKADETNQKKSDDKGIPSSVDPGKYQIPGSAKVNINLFTRPREESKKEKSDQKSHGYQKSSNGGVSNQNPSNGGVSNQNPSNGGGGSAQKPSNGGGGSAQKPSNGGGGSAQKSSNGGGGSAQKPSNGGGGSAQKSSNGGGGSAQKSSNGGGGSAQKSSNGGGGSAQKSSNGGGGSAQKPSNGGGGSAQKPSNGGGGSAQKPSNGGGGSAQKPSNGGGGSAQKPSNGGGGSAQKPSNGGGGSAQKPSNGSGGSAQKPSNGSGGSAQKPSNGGGEGSQKPSDGGSAQKPSNGGGEGSQKPSDGGSAQKPAGGASNKENKSSTDKKDSSSQDKSSQSGSSNSSSDSKSSGGGALSITSDQINEAMGEVGFTPNSEYVDAVVKITNEEFNDINMAAMFLAQLAHESGGFQHIEEVACAGSTKCADQYGGSEGAPGKSYHGRGFIQLSWPANYKEAGEALGMGDQLFDNPDMVSEDPELGAKVSNWYWKSRVETAPGVSDFKFGATTKAINGALECTGSNIEQSKKRYEFYKAVAGALGVTDLASEDGCY
ncbi:hypothetical protein P3W45_000920 [Vairimorpha bombi]